MKEQLLAIIKEATILKQEDISLSYTKEEREYIVKCIKKGW